MIKKYLLVLIIGLLAAGQALADEAQKREMRSTWIATVSRIDWPTTYGTSSTWVSQQKAALKQMIERLHEQNFNAVSFQVRSYCDAMYDSKYEPWSRYLTGTRGQNPGFDPLAYAIEVAHGCGMELHAWINPFRYSSGGEDFWTQWSVNKKALSQDTQLKGTLLSNGNAVILDPANPATTTRIVNVCKDIIDKYNVDGIMFDDYFYPSGIPSNSSAGDYTEWQKSGTSKNIGDWRRENVNKVVKAVWDMIQQTKPQVRFGIAPQGNYNGPATTTYGIDTKCPHAGSDQYNSIFSDPLAWLKAGTIDYISPQLYWLISTTNTWDFRRNTEWWSKVAHKFDRHYYASQADYGDDGTYKIITKSRNETECAEVVNQTKYSRQYNQDNAPGVVLYSAKNINGDNGGNSVLGDYLKTNLFQHPALVPAVTWKKATALGVPQNLTYSGNQLTWAAQTGTLIKYAIYAIPNSMNSADITSSKFAGIKSDYLLGLTYTNSYTVPTAYRSGYWFAVTIVDGYDNEYAPAYANEPTPPKPTPATALTAPANGASVDADFTFSCTNVGADTYTLQVSSASNFSTVSYTAAMTAGASAVTAPMQVALLGKGTFYWRVLTKSNGMSQSVSPTWSFTVTNVPTGNYEKGYVIKKDVDAPYRSGGMVLASLWFRSVLTTPDYNNIAFESDGSYNRGFTVIGDRIYVAGRKAASYTAQCYIQVYDAATGEHIKDLNIGALNTKYLPCNDVLADDAGHLIVANLTTDASTDPLRLHLINTSTGKASSMGTFKLTEKGRIDHCGIVGNISSGNYTVMAAIAATNKIATWTVKSGEITATTLKAVQNLSPSSSKDFGTAPRIMPVSATEALVSGSKTNLTRYNVVQGTLTGDMSGNSAILPKSQSMNGGAQFTLGGVNYLLYPYADRNGSNGIQWELARSTTTTAFTDFSQLQVFPKQGIGETPMGGSDNGAPCITVSDADGVSQLIYVYVPGNGLAAYRLTPEVPAFTQSVAGQHSRYDRANQVNRYQNTINLTAKSAADFSNIASYPGPYAVTRQASTGASAQIATVQFTKASSGYSYAVTYNASTQNTKLTYSNEVPATSGTVDKVDTPIAIADRFTASTDANQQPDSYTYSLTHEGQSVASNVTVPVVKTAVTVQRQGLTRDDVDADVKHTLAAGVSNQVAIATQDEGVTRYDLLRGSDGTVVASAQADGTGRATLTDHCNIDGNTTSYVAVAYKASGDSYGSNTVTQPVPAFDITLLDQSKTVSKKGKNEQFMFYKAVLAISPQETGMNDLNVYRYHVWRVEDGKETLIDTLKTVSEDTWSTDYTPLQGTFVGNNEQQITDRYLARAIFNDQADYADTKTVTYVARMYVTPLAAGEAAPRRAPGASSGSYYLIERQLPVTYDGHTRTAVEQVVAEPTATVTRVSYFNPLGQQSSQPWPGVNVRVTTYDNGTQRAQKLVR